MTAPSSSPRGERGGKPGSSWESWVEWTAETWEPEQDTAPRSVLEPDTSTSFGANQPQPPSPPNRAARRAIARANRRSAR